MNAGIADRYYGAASATPARVFGALTARRPDARLRGGEAEAWASGSVRASEAIMDSPAAGAAAHPAAGGAGPVRRWATTTNAPIRPVKAKAEAAESDASSDEDADLMLARRPAAPPRVRAVLRREERQSQTATRTPATCRALDPETGHGLVSDVCLKRKIRNYVEIAKSDAPQFRIYVTEGAVLNEKHREAYVALRPGDAEVASPKTKKLTPKNDDEAAKLRGFMCDNFYDIRTFGGVLSTGINAGQVRGPVQIGFAQSVEPVLPLEVSITRMAATSEADKKDRAEGDDTEEKRGDKRTMGRKHIIPYGLYRAHGFVSAPAGARQRARAPASPRRTLALLFEALRDMFEHDRSAARGEMTTRRLVVFRHACGARQRPGAGPVLPASRPGATTTASEAAAIGSARRWTTRPPARSFDDYVIKLDGDGHAGRDRDAGHGVSPGLPIVTLTPMLDFAAEDGLIPLSALQHHLFCPRQCALIHVEQVWAEDGATAEGRVLHERVDAGGAESAAGPPGGARALRLRSLRALGVSGQGRRRRVPTAARRDPSLWSTSAASRSRTGRTRCSSARRHCAWRRCSEFPCQRVRSSTAPCAAGRPSYSIWLCAR